MTVYPEAGRFHRGISLAVALIAGLISLQRRFATTTRSPSSGPCWASTW